MTHEADAAVVREFLSRQRLHFRLVPKSEVPKYKRKRAMRKNAENGLLIICSGLVVSAYTSGDVWVMNRSGQWFIAKGSR